MAKLAKGLKDGAGHCKEGFRIEERGQTARIVDEHYTRVQLPRLLRRGLPIPNSERARAWAETLAPEERAKVRFVRGIVRRDSRFPKDHYLQVQLPRMLRLGLPIPNSERARAWAETLAPEERARVKFADRAKGQRERPAKWNVQFGELTLHSPRRAPVVELTYRGERITVKFADLMDDTELWRAAHWQWTEIRGAKLLGAQPEDAY